MKTLFPPIEPLESRIAPAAVTITYTDIDGDKVHITDSSGNLTAGDLTFVGGGTSGALSELNLTAAGFAGANITFTVTHKAGGDGVANVGLIDAAGVKLGNVTVDGDLGRILAGDGSGTAIKSLSVKSMGQLGVDSQKGLLNPSLTSTISGSVEALKVARDVTGAYVSVTSGNIGKITIGGSLVGGGGTNSGEISSGGNIGVVKIGGDVLGGAGNHSGQVLAGGTLASATVSGSIIGGAGNESGNISSMGNIGVIIIGHDMAGGGGQDSGYIGSFSGGLASATVGGSLIGGAGINSGKFQIEENITAVTIGDDIVGGAGPSSGFIESQGKLVSATVSGSLVGGSGGQSGQVYSEGSIGNVKIGHDMVGGTAYGAGYVDTFGTIGNVTIGGSLIGGTAGKTGYLLSGGNMGAVTIGGNLTGGSISGTTAGLAESGLILSRNGNIASVTVRGSIVSGSDTSTGGALSYNASIRAGEELGALTVGGSIVGNPDGGTGNAASPVVISAAEVVNGTAKTDMAIGSISVAGRVDDAVFLAGYNTGLTAVSGSAQIGAVKVGGAWIASDLVAGITNSDTTGAPFPNFGNVEDAVATGQTPGIIAKIASITIGGEVYGTPASVNSTDNFGFVAEGIGAVKIGGFAVTVLSGGDPQAVGETGDVDIHEVIVV